MEIHYLTVNASEKGRTMRSHEVSLKPPLRALHSGVRTAAHITTSSAPFFFLDVGNELIPAACGTALLGGVR